MTSSSSVDILLHAATELHLPEIKIWYKSIYFYNKIVLTENRKIFDNHLLIGSTKDYKIVGYEETTYPESFWEYEKEK